MSRFLSSFWAQKPQPEDGADGGGAMGGSTADGATGAASWITMKDPSAGDRGEPVMAVNQATVKGVLEPLGDKEAVNLVAIFGAARGGKSFLMNQLAGQDDIFKISNDKDPCTQGVDVSRAVVPLKEFATLDGCTAPRGVAAGSKVRVLFADVEGQGDRDAAYDARLASAILPLTKCVVFNWRDSLQVDRMLNLLGVMQRAAHNVDLGDDGEGSAGPKFGHLHVVFRDWNYSGTAEDVKKQLFGLDNRGMGAEVAVKNELRRTIKAAFASVTVWLFPAPVEMTSELSKELKSEDLSEGFVTQLAAFRTALSAQLSAPTVFGLADPVTGHSLGSLVPALVDVLNKGEVIMPQSAYQQMLATEARQVKETYLLKADALIKTGMAACDSGPPVPPKDLEDDMGEEMQTLVADFEREAKAIGAKDDVVAEGVRDVRANLERGMVGLRAHNTSALGRHLKAAVKEARASFTAEFTQGVRASMPLPRSELAAMAKAASSRARGRLQAVPSTGAGDDSLEEALAALSDFVELAASKAERENEALVQAQGKKEEDALAAAARSFEEEFKADLDAVKAGGGPYKVAAVEGAGKAALTTASAALRLALSPDGGVSGGNSERVNSMVTRLEEGTKAKIAEERAELDRSCTAFMMKLGREERHRLREEVESDVYPLLPLYETPELEAAFKPTVQRMNDRIDESGKGWSLTEQAHAQYMDSAKFDAESVWQSLFERNERIKLQRENAEVGADAQRQREEAEQLRNHLEEERRRVAEAEGNARSATVAAAEARNAAVEAKQRARLAVGARAREAAAHEKEKREEEARRAEEREKSAADKARAARAAASREAALTAAARKAAAGEAEARRVAEREATLREEAALEATRESAREKLAWENTREEAAEEARETALYLAAQAKSDREFEARVAREKEEAARKALEEEEAAVAKASAAAAAAAAAAEAAAAKAKKAQDDEAAAKEAAEAKKKEEEEEGFEDAMSEEVEEEEEEVEVKKERAPKRGRRSARGGKGTAAMEVEEEEEEAKPNKRARTSARRKTIMTPVGKDPAALKKAREEAAQKIKNTQEAKAGKISPGKPKAEEEEEEEEEEEDAGMTEIEKSRMRAKKWAKEQKDKKAAAAKKKKETAAKAAKAATAAKPAATPKKRGTPARGRK